MSALKKYRVTIWPFGQDDAFFWEEDCVDLSPIDAMMTCFASFEEIYPNGGDKLGTISCEEIQHG